MFLILSPLHKNKYIKNHVIDVFKIVFLCLKPKILNTGVAIGAGWQSVVAFVNIGCYYVVGIPLGVLLAYVADLSVQVSISMITTKTILRYWKHWQ